MGLSDRSLKYFSQFYSTRCVYPHLVLIRTTQACPYFLLLQGCQFHIKPINTEEVWIALELVSCDSGAQLMSILLGLVFRPAPERCLSQESDFALQLCLAVVRVRGQRLWIATLWLSQGPVR